jgi:hypothetical protein
MNHKSRRRIKNDRKAKVSEPLSVTWRSDGPSRVSIVRDLSISGIFVCTERPLKRGARIQLLFSLPGGGVRVDGVVRHTLPGQGMGVEFTYVARRDYTRMREVIRRWNS